MTQDTDSFSDWMSNLSDELTLRPLNELAIPGSHNSFTYAITAHSEPSPDGDAYNLVRNLPPSIAGPMLYPWSATQASNVTEQLEGGIRYLDLRVGVRPGQSTSDSFYFVHGQYACPVVDALRLVAQFLRQHPREVLLLDFNHHYGFTSDQHRVDFEAVVISVLGSFLYPRQEKIPSLAEMWKAGKQVLFFSCFASTGKVFWPGNQVISHWPNTIHVEKMIKYLDDRYGDNSHRNPNAINVLQGVLTPNAEYIFYNLGASLRKLSKQAGEAFNTWIQAPGRSAGLRGVNVTLLDFVITDFPDYVANVIALNNRN